MSPNRIVTTPQSSKSSSESTISPDVAEHRLATLRRQIPETLVQIDAVRSDDTAIAVKATIGLPGGARHSFIATTDVDPDTSWADQLAAVQAVAIVKALDGLGQPSVPEDRPQEASIPESAQSRRQTPSAQADDDHLPEYSWNAFWQTMNSRNITREQVEQALGKSVQEATPKEAVDALRAAGVLE